MSNRKVSVVGLGKLGAPLAAVLSAAGHDVVGVDINDSYVRAINEGRSPVEEPGLEELIAANKSRLTGTGDTAAAVLQSEATFVIVPTPSDANGEFSASAVIGACDAIGAALRKLDRRHLVVLCSTVMPGTSEGAVLPALEESSGKKAGTDFGYCYNPEFIALGSVIRDTRNPDMFLVGEIDEWSGDTLLEIFQPVHENTPSVKRMSPVNAEIAKISVNAFVTMKISFANMIGQMCEEVPGADATVVCSAVGEDSRIGTRYLLPALGFGGPCFPRDNVALAALQRRLGTPSELPEATDAVNRAHIAHVADLVASNTQPGSRVAVLGLSYKPETNVIEESQGVWLARVLVSKGFHVITHDPKALAEIEAVKQSVDLADAIAQADTVVICTPWPQYSDLPLSGVPQGRRLKIVDCWNLLSHMTSSHEQVELIPFARSEARTSAPRRAGS